MENCALYSHYLKFDNIINIVKEQLPKAKIEKEINGNQKSLKISVKSGLFSKSKLLTINYRARKNPSHTLNEPQCGLENNLNGMVNFVQSIPLENQEIKQRFLIKIKAVNSEIAFIAEPSINESFRAILKRIAVELDAFIFTAPSSVFRKSETQHFIDKHFKLITDTTGKSEVDSIEVNIESSYLDENQDNATQEQIDRKTQSEAFLQSHDIKVNHNLPFTPDSSNVQIRTKAELAHRIYALLLIAARGEGIEKAKTDQLKDKLNIISLSAREKAVYYSDELSPEDSVYASWRYESLHQLLWAVGKMDYSFPSEMCNVAQMVGMMMSSSKDEFIASWNIKSTNEILDELDKIYRMNWACVDARIKGQAPKGSIHPSVVYERHYALNWLTNYQKQEWDQIQTNT